LRRALRFDAAGLGAAAGGVGTGFALLHVPHWLF